MPEKRNVPSLKRAIVWGLLVVVIFAAILVSNGMPIRVSDGLQAVQSPDPLSNEGEYFAHWQMVVFQRVLEIAPADAYRGPVLSRRFEMIVMDTWPRWRQELLYRATRLNEIAIAAWFCLNLS